MNPEQLEDRSPGTGSTPELSLRVSIATLVRVLFTDPRDGEWKLALERRATLYDAETGLIEIKSQPFGGAIRVHDLSTLQKVTGGFHFDSVESQAEQDFRIFVRPSVWGTLRDFCLEHLKEPHDPVLETDATRELAEEFADTLGGRLKPDQYTLRVVGTIVEAHPSATENIYARGYATSRIYRIFEAHVLDPALISALIKNSEGCSDRKLHELALQDAQAGGPGRVNAVLTLPFREIKSFYETVPSERRSQPIAFHEHLLDETVAALLDGVHVPKYQRWEA